jgi:uncharacterized protein (TIGR03382 family)
MRTTTGILAFGTSVTALLALGGCATVEDEAPAAQARAAAPAQNGSGLPRIDRVITGSDGLPTFLRGDLGRLTPGTPDPVIALEPALPAIAAAFRLRAEDLVLVKAERDPQGMTHVRYQQHKHGLRVVGGQLVVHVAADGVIRSVTSDAKDGVDVDPVPTIERDAAIATAIAATADGQVDLHNADLVYLLTEARGLHLAWELELLGQDGIAVADRVFVDAHRGDVIDRHPQIFPIKNREIFDAQGRSPPYSATPGPVLGREGQPPTDAVGLAAYDNTGSTYDCYQQLYQRDSYDNAGAKLTSVVHATFRTPTGQTTANNAAWVAAFGPGMMVYGDGDGRLMTALARSFDVTAHELTHAVTSETAALAYRNESGAINEAMSDIMAAVCEAWKDRAVSGDTWLVGEDVFTPTTAGDAMRYMADPTRDRTLYPAELGGSRDFYADRYTGTQDNGGVHLNSGIANLAFYLLSQGGRHPRNRTTFTVPAIGIEKAGAIFQRALTQGYLTQNSNFAAARAATEEAAGDLYGASDVLAVGTAWAAVGVGAPPATGPDTTPPTVAITAPTSGASVTPGFAIAVTATDDQGVQRVEVAIDGTAVGTDNVPPYEFSAPADLATGSHTITATAFDAANQATATATVTVVGADQVCEPACGEGETCVDNVCVPTPSADGDAGGCCGTSSSPTSALGALGVAAVLGLRRRRRLRRGRAGTSERTSDARSSCS